MRYNASNNKRETLKLTFDVSRLTIMRPRHFILLLILIAATALRLYHLDTRALWWDEGLSLFFARLGYVENAGMAVTLADTNPPIYRLLLGVWISLLGSSAFMTRLFSALPGIVTVAFTYRLARQLHFSVVTGLIASALCAASPMLIYYAQEAKGYSLVAMAGVASVVLWLGFIALTPVPVAPPLAGSLVTAVRQTHRSSPERGVRAQSLGWLLYAIMLLLMVGSHYISAFLILVENLWSFVLTLRLWRGNEKHWIKRWAWLIGAQALVAVVLLPFVLLTFGGTSAAVRGETGEFANLDPVQFIVRHAIDLTQGPTAEGMSAGGIAIVIIGLLVIGWWRLETRRETWRIGGRWLLGSWIVIPIALGFALNAYHEFFFPRFVLYTVPAIMLLVAGGISQLSFAVSRLISRIIRPTIVVTASIVSLVVLGLWSPTLLIHYNAPTAPGEDWRPVADTLRPLVREGDAAIYTWGWIPGYLDAYLPPAPHPDYELGFFTPETLDTQMANITANRKRVWLFDYEIDQFDVRNLAGNWLRTRAALVYEAWPGEGKGHVALFTLKPSSSTSSKTVTTTFANGLKLETQETILTGSPGDAVTVLLKWSPAQPLTDRYTIFLHGTAEDGSLAFGRDAEPYNGAKPVTDWKVGESYEELRGVLLPPKLPPGKYILSVGMYKTATGEADAAGAVTVGEVVIP